MNDSDFVLGVRVTKLGDFNHVNEIAFESMPITNEATGGKDTLQIGFNSVHNALKTNQRLLKG